MTDQDSRSPKLRRRALLAGAGISTAVVATSLVPSAVSAEETPGSLINVMSFGAKGDGITDDGPAIIAAVEHAKSMAAGGLRPTILFPTSKGYLSNQTIQIPTNMHVIMDSPVAYGGPVDTPAMIVGQPDLANVNVRLKLSVKRKAGAGYADWTNENGVGLLLKNLDTSIIEIVQSTGFTIGVQAMGDSGGFAYNEVHLGLIMDNKIGIDLTNKNSGTGIGWCNENMFLAGRIGCFSTTKRKVGRIGVRITSADRTYINNNNNNFYKPNFELQFRSSTPEEALPILIEYGRLNRFFNVRNENNSTVTARIGPESYENTIDLGYGQVVIDDQGNYPSTVARSARSGLTDFAGAIFISGLLTAKACYYDGDTQVNIPGLGFSSAKNGGIRPSGKVTLSKEFIEIGSEDQDAVGVFVDTTNTRRFVVKTDTAAGHGGRIHLVCYGADGNILADVGKPLAKTKVSYKVAWQPNLFGGSYQTITDRADTIESDFFFTVTPEVAKVRVLFWTGTASLQLRSFSVYSVDHGSPAVWSGIPESAGALNVGTKHPTTGEWPRGKIVMNAEPSVLTGASRFGPCVIDGWRKITDGDKNQPGVDWLEILAPVTPPR